MDAHSKAGCPPVDAAAFASQAGISSIPDQATERELVVHVNPVFWHDFWVLEGTRAQLEAEGVIPPGTQWPEGACDHRWTAGRFRYWLRRTRPAGLKGPMRVWTSGDWWALRCSLIDGPDQEARKIIEKTRELAEELRRQSPAGRLEMRAHWNRYWKAQEDEAFQSFKDKLVPQRKKPGRTPGTARGGAGPAVTKALGS